MKFIKIIVFIHSHDFSPFFNRVWELTSDRSYKNYQINKNFHQSIACLNFWCLKILSIFSLHNFLKCLTTLNLHSKFRSYKCTIRAVYLFHKVCNDHYFLILEHFCYFKGPYSLADALHSLLLLVPGLHQSPFFVCLLLWVCLFWTLYANGII
jgi:hypothetical protein